MVGHYILEINRHIQIMNFERGSIAYRMTHCMFSFLVDVSLKYCRFCQHTFLKLQHNLHSQKGARWNWLVQIPSLLEPGPQHVDT